jgi:hypothetical protein
MSTQTVIDTEGRRSPASTIRRTSSFTETKSGFKTSEFYVTLLFVAGVLFAAYAAGSDAFARDEGWLFATIVVAGYVVSRGLAKLATREPYEDNDR